MSTIQVYSEIDTLEGVILHPPGPEVENMTPKNAERALYSDILNLSVARREYNQLECLMQKLAPTFRVRDREAQIMQAIFDYHPRFRAKTFNPTNEADNRRDVSIEGGDLIIAAEHITLVGLGARTTSGGIDFLVKMCSEQKGKHHILVQELPTSPESFIHLDMVFTLLDKDSCMVYAPLILKSNKYQTIQIDIDNGKVVSIRNVENLLKALSRLGMDLKPSYCGGQKDSMTQEREQWHSGANFFAVGPGKLIGYNGNIHTLEDLHRSGYEIIKSREVVDGRIDLSTYEKFVLTIDGAELSRGGGGVRCMTMPFRRKHD